MQVSVEATGGLERRMTVQVPADRIEKEVETRLKSLARQTKMDGFRPGKVPFSIVRRRYGSQVRQEVIGEVVQASFYEAVAKEQLRPAGAPRIEPKPIEAGKELEYSAIFEVYPEIEVKGVESIKVERPQAEVTDADVEKMIETLRKQRITWNEVERASQNGDRVMIDYHGTINGEEFSGNTGQQVPVVLGSGAMIKGFEEKLMGVTAGDEITAEMEFPEDYHAKEVAGKPVKFEVKVHSVAEPMLPEVDDTFAKSFGVSEGGVEGLRAEVRDNMARELEQAIKSKVKKQVMDALLEANPVDLPSALVEQEVDQLVQQTKQQTGGGNFEPPRTLFEDQARRRVALGLILGELIKANDIKVDQDRVRAAVESVAVTYDEPEAVVKWYYGDKERLRGVETAVLEDQVVDWVVERVQVEEAKSSFDAVMNPDKTADEA